MAIPQSATKFQRISQYFKGDNYTNHKTNYDNPQTLLTTTNQSEYETAKLEKQQTKYLKGIWKKVSTHIHQKALVYETQRYPSYLDYDLMEQYPIIGQALDILAEESTTTNDKGKVLNIFSQSKRVQNELNDLFYNKLNVHTNLFMWTRNMIKYGDNFVYLQLSDTDGIVGGKQLTNIEVERLEGGYGNMQHYLNADSDEVTFRWKATEMAEFKYYQIAHFRLLTDDKRLPYGVSVLEKARRIWKNLLLVEDAMRTIRLLRAIDRRAYYINVGNIDPQDVQGYIEDIASRFKRKRHIDPHTGQEDLKYNVVGYDQDYFIPIRDESDGTRIETIQGASNLSEIADIEYDLNQLFAALGIPKPFLQYEDVAGEGKNLSMQDIRFARKINRIQQSVIHELNKIAIIHLFFLGLEDELNNFELSLNNPSIQVDIMRTEYLGQKISVFKDAVSDANGNGIAAYSITKGMKEILGFTDNEIKLCLEQQFMEKAMAAEIEGASQVITNTTIFDNIVKLYGSKNIEDIAKDGEDGGTSGGGGGGGGGGDFGLGGDMGGDFGDEDLGGDEGGDLDLGTDEGTEGGEDLDLGGDNEAEPTTEDKLGESFANFKSDKLILEKSNDRIMNLFKFIK